MAQAATGGEYQNRAGNGCISVECRNDGTSVASELFAEYPLRFHLTSSPENDVMFDDNDIMNEEQQSTHHTSVASKALTCYVLGYGGGLISGDTINLSINVKPQASLIVTSQSTSKAFKAIPNRKATLLTTKARVVGKGSLLFLVPQPTQCFGESRLRQETHVVMDDCGSANNNDKPSLLLVDWYTGGRKNHGGLWQFDSFQSTTTISYDQSQNQSYDVCDDDTMRSTRLAFRDSTRLTGGQDLARHMRQFNIVCMVVLIGPRVQQKAKDFQKIFSSRHSYEETDDNNNNNNNTSNMMDGATSTKTGEAMNYIRGEGLNHSDEGLLVSCGTFDLKKNRNDDDGEANNEDKGIVVRLAATTLEKAAKFLSKYIGDLDGQLEDDPFMEILSSKHLTNHGKVTSENDTSSRKRQSNSSPSLGLIEKSFEKNLLTPTISSTQSISNPIDMTTKMSVNPLVLYQLVDSCAPTGGFAHSNTLEVAHQLHLLKSQPSLVPSLVEHTWDVILQTFTSTIPFLLSSCRLLRSYLNESQQSSSSSSSIPTKDVHSNTHNQSQTLPSPSKAFVNAWFDIDTQMSTTVTSHVANRASSLQGSGTFRAFSCSFPHIAPVLKALKKRILLEECHHRSGDEGSYGHAATCFGAVCGLLNIDDSTCTSMFLYTTARDMINAAVRMNLCGPFEGGRLTNELCVNVERLIETHLSQLNVTVLDESEENGAEMEIDTEIRNSSSIHESLHQSHQVAPLVEILSNAHDRLYTRLFNS